MSMLRKVAMRATATLSVLALVGGLSTAAQAVTYTEIKPTPWGVERNIDQILGTVYGGTFSLVGKNYANEFGIVAERLADVSLDGNDDRFWAGGIYRTEVKARFAGATQEFGFLPNNSGGTYSSLFEVDGYGYDVTGTATVDLSSLDTLRWARSGAGGTFASNPANNGPLMNDHLVSYKITGLTGPRYELTRHTWMLFWEDTRGLGDQDYNDLVLEISSVIPEPVTATLFAMGVSSLVFSIRRRR